MSRQDVAKQETQEQEQETQGQETQEQETQEKVGQKMKEQGFSAETGEQTGQESLQESLQGSFLERHSLSLADVVLQGDAQEGTVVLPLPANLSLGQGGMRFVREGDDLVIASGMESSSGVVVVEGYFTASPPPVLTTAMGGAFSPSLVESFLEQGSLAQKYALGEVGGWIADKIGGNIGGKIGGSEKQVIGEIVSLEGEVQVVRYGVMITLKMGDKILEDDIVSTGKQAEVFMRFTDKMEFRLGENARLAIDEYLYDEVNSSGIQALSIIAGAFSYASGLIGGADPSSVRLQTPYGVIGIRGTKILGDVRDEELSVTVLEGSVALLRDGREAALLDEPFETLSLSLKGAVPRVEIEIASVERVLREYDLLDNSEQQLRALESGEALEDEISESTGEGASEGAGDVEQVALPDSAEVYIEPVLAVAETSFLSRAEQDAADKDDVSAEDEASEQSLVVDDDDDIVGSAVSPRVLSAGELSFEGSSVGVRFILFGIDPLVFDDDAGVVYRHGGDVSVVRQSKEGLEGRHEFVVSGVADVTGGRLHDRFVGNDEANRLVGGGGEDILNGGGGNDRLTGGAGYDRLYGDAGNDIIRGGSGNDDLFGGDDRYGGADLGNDQLYGGAGRDRIYGGAGNDSLQGENGADTLYGGAGKDKLYGGAGKDKYVFEVGDGTDTIRDTAGETMTLRFDGSAYEAADFLQASDNFKREGDNLEITIDKDSTDSITDKITIVDAYNDDSNIGTGNAAFTINIEFGGSKVADADAFWHGLTI